MKPGRAPGLPRPSCPLLTAVCLWRLRFGMLRRFCATCAGAGHTRECRCDGPLAVVDAKDPPPQWNALEVVAGGPAPFWGLACSGGWPGGVGSALLLRCGVLVLAGGARLWAVSGVAVGTYWFFGVLGGLGV